MDGFLTATLGSALAGAPEWVHLVPSGHVQNRLGPPFRMDNPDIVLQMFAERGIDLPTLYEHQNDKLDAKLKGPNLQNAWASGRLDQGIAGARRWYLGARSVDGLAARDDRRQGIPLP